MQTGLKEEKKVAAPVAHFCQDLDLSLERLKSVLRLAADGYEPWQQAVDVVAGTPPQFGQFIKDEIDKWSNVARVANIKPE